MKSILFSLVVLFSMQAFTCDLQEAQIIAKVAALEPHETGCSAFVKSSDVKLFMSKDSCPLVIGEVSNAPIEIGLNSQGQCRYDVGQVLSGIVYKTKTGSLELY